MLSRGGGAVAFQKVVSRVSDLPSPLDAEPGSRIIVRETEEVYGLNATTRMWEPIGTLKKVGGKRPEELAAHVDSSGNPHKTSLQSVLAAGSRATVAQEITITGKSTSLRLLSGTSALRVGTDAGKKGGTFWVNAGNQGRAKTVLRVVSADGKDQVVLTGDGSIVSAGSANFAGGFKGAAHFDDEITASEGLFGAAGYDLVLGGDKGVLTKVGGQEKALLTEHQLTLKVDLVTRGLSISGAVQGNLNPSGAHTLGAPQARWKSAAVGDLDVAGQLSVSSPANSKQPPLQITASAPGHGLTVTPQGALGLGTDSPESRLDVRGDLLVGSGDSRLKLDSTGLECGGWHVRYGSDLTFACGGGVVIKSNSAGTTLSGGVKVEGDLVVSGKLALGGVSGLNKQGVVFKSNGSTTYKAKAHQLDGAVAVNAAKGEDPLTVKSSGDVLFAVGADGTLLGSKLGSPNATWDNAYFEKSAVVGDTSYESGRISHSGDLVVDANTLMVPALRIGGHAPRVEVLNELKLAGGGGSATFAMGGPACGLSFEGKSWQLDGVSKLNAGSINTKELKASGGATFCDGSASFSKSGLALTGSLSVGGLAFKKVVENLKLNGTATQTKFQLPVGVRVEAVIVKLTSAVTGARFLQVGDTSDPDRFATPCTNLKAGSLIRGLNHWSQGRAVQKVSSPVVVSADESASGTVQVTIHYVDPAAF